MVPVVLKLEGDGLKEQEKLAKRVPVKLRQSCEGARRDGTSGDSI